MLRVLTSTLLLAAAVLAEPADPVPASEAAVEPPQPNVRKLGDGNFALGLVKFQQKNRHVSFPAEVNMIEGLLEYAIVHQNGKIHEALLHTKTNPLHVNLALKLLRYEASAELIQILDENYKPTGKYPAVSEATKAAARVEILLSWKKGDGSEGKASLNEWITNTATEAPIPATPWVYGGSYFHNKIFQAESSGDIAAIFTSSSALFNYPGTGHMDDEIWIPTPERIPTVGTPVTVTITPTGSH